MPIIYPNPKDPCLRNLIAELTVEWMTIFDDLQSNEITLTRSEIVDLIFDACTRATLDAQRIHLIECKN